MEHRKIRCLGPCPPFKADAVVEVQTNEEGEPLSRDWRRRLQDGSAELVKATASKRSAPKPPEGDPE